jgi:hypothetical protein
MLPKIHKPNIPGRPIISGCDSPTEKLSTFIDHYLKQLVPFIPSYIKDTTHFLRMVFDIPTPLPPNSLLVTIDVVSLYTNIPQDEGIRTTLKALSHFPEHSIPPLAVFHRFLQFILKNNYFSFNNQFYLQTMGTAMGTRMAPSFANIFLYYLEGNLLSSPPNNLKPLLWKRYIDDIFMIWPHGIDTLNEFINYINDYHTTIKFQFSSSSTQINFLDTTIYLTKEGRLESTIYTKPTDSNLLLHYTSHHPNKCKSGLIYSQALRLRRIITDNNNLHKQLHKLQLILLTRGFPLPTITEQFNKILTLNQTQLLNKNTKKSSRENHEVLPFTVPYHQVLHGIPQILHKFWFLIERDPELSKIFPKPPITAYSRHKNMKDILVHTKFITHNTHHTNH